MESSTFVPATELELETGLGKDLLRKWRTRYGFPTPECQADGRTGYSRQQVHQLRLIKQLLDSGFRPSQIVGKSLGELEQRFYAPSVCSFPDWSPSTRDALDCLKRQDLMGLHDLLTRERAKKSLANFVCDTVAPLVTGIGEAWASRAIEVYQEHLFTSALTRFLSMELLGPASQGSRPTVLLATPPEELHVLGLLMAEAVLTDGGARCINIGPQVAMNDLALAAEAYQADIVALSFSFSYPARRVRPTVEQLRTLLPDNVDIWIGGAGAAVIKRPPRGVRVFLDLKPLQEAIRNVSFANQAMD